MNYVLSIVLPPIGPASFGQAITVDGLRNPVEIAATVRAHLRVRQGGETTTPDDRFAANVGNGPSDAEHTHKTTGQTFRIDPADQAPHPCPCCERLVLPTDHAYADDEDAYCLGCFTWKRGVPQCLPENSAHTEEP